jgi:hypothetical protein
MSTGGGASSAGELGGPVHRVEDEGVVLHAQQPEALPATEGELRHRHLARTLEGLAQQLVRLRGDLAVGLQVVGVADPDGVDRLGRHERDDVDGLRGGERHALEVLVGDRDQGVFGDFVPLTISSSQSCRPSSSQILR